MAENRDLFYIRSLKFEAAENVFMGHIPSISFFRFIFFILLCTGIAKEKKKKLNYQITIHYVYFIKQAVSTKGYETFGKNISKVFW